MQSHHSRTLGGILLNVLVLETSVPSCLVNVELGSFDFFFNEN